MFKGFDLTKISKEFLYSDSLYCKFITDNSQWCRGKLEDMKASE